MDGFMVDQDAFELVVRVTADGMATVMVGSVVMTTRAKIRAVAARLDDLRYTPWLRFADDVANDR